MIKFNCSQCGHTMKVPDAAAGKRGKCKKCGEVMGVPMLSEPEPVALSTPAADSLDGFPELENLPEEDYGFPPILPEEPPEEEFTALPNRNRRGRPVRYERREELQSSDQRYPMLSLYLMIIKILIVITYVVVLIFGGIIVYGMIDASLKVAEQLDTQAKLTPIITTTIAYFMVATFILVAALAAIEFARVIIDTEYNTRKIAARL